MGSGSSSSPHLPSPVVARCYGAHTERTFLKRPFLNLSPGCGCKRRAAKMTHSNYQPGEHSVDKLSSAFSRYIKPEHTPDLPDWSPSPVGSDGLEERTSLHQLHCSTRPQNLQPVLLFFPVHTFPVSQARQGTDKTTHFGAQATGS